ncbi:putative protein OS=Streptomyces fumanus OX=67302 GN=GCM10018772_46180 PE=4 SV=1 [Streptomyces fumanus]
MHTVRDDDLDTDLDEELVDEDEDLEPLDADR